MRSVPSALVIAMLLAGCAGATVPGGDASPHPSATATATDEASMPASPLPSAPATATATPPPTAPATAVAPATSAPSPTPLAPSAAPEPVDAPAVYLSGPFGRLDGEVGESAGEPGQNGLRVLDTYFRNAPLSAGLRDRDLGFGSWTVTAVDLEDPSRNVTLAEGTPEDDSPPSIRITGPDTGRWVLRLVASTTAAPVDLQWHLDVPARKPPADGFYDVPAPDLLARGSGREVVTDRGSGCYVYTCGDIGMLPRADSLPLVRADDGTVTLRLDDDSGLVRWQVMGWPVGDRDAERRLAAGRADDGDPRPTFDLPSGDWFLTIQVWFDLERGDWYHYLRAVAA